MSDCKYYKCHDVSDEEYDCSLCYCPFYKICFETKKYKLFGGYILDNKLLACEKCVYFHKKSNVEVYNKLKNENMSLDEIFDYFVKLEENKRADII
ncbi:MAG: cysteine-rich small domain-containing protein [Clostridia bacterium]